MNTLVWIVQDKNKEAFEITRESLNRKAPIKIYSDDKEQIIIYKCKQWICNFVKRFRKQHRKSNYLERLT